MQAELASYASQREVAGRADRGRRYLHGTGDLGRGETLSDVQSQRQALAGGEYVHGPADEVAVQAILLKTTPVVGDSSDVHGMFFQQATVTGSTRGAVSAQIAQHRDRPGTEALLRGKGVKLAEDTHPRLLHEVLRLQFGAGVGARSRHQKGKMPGVEHRDGFVAAALGQFDQIVIRQMGHV